MVAKGQDRSHGAEGVMRCAAVGRRRADGGRAARRLVALGAPAHVASRRHTVGRGWRVNQDRDMPGRCHARRLRRLRSHLSLSGGAGAPASSSAEPAAPVARADADRQGSAAAATVATFCDGVDLSAAHEALRILRHFQQGQAPPDDADADTAAQMMSDMMSDRAGPNASRYIGCVVDASSRGGLDGFSTAELAAMKRAVYSRGAVVVRGVRPEMDGSNATSVAGFLRHFGEPRAEYFGNPEKERLVAQRSKQWHADLPLGTLQRFSNDGDGVLLKSSSDELVAAGELAWHFDGEFNPWWTAHTSLFCEATPYAGHATGYASQRAAYLAALAQVPELISRLRGMRSLCTIEGINIGGGNPGRIDLGFTREVQLEAATPDTDKLQETGTVTMSPEKYPPQHKPLLRTHYAADFECFSAILCYLPEFAKHWQTRHLVNVVDADGREMGPDQASALLSSLLRFITQDAFRYYHEWQAGDLVIWCAASLADSPSFHLLY